MKKQSAEWYIAVTHYLTVGLFSLVSSIIVGMITAVAIQDQGFLDIINGIFYLAITWFAVRYSAGYLDKTYLIKDSQKIITLSTVYFVVISYTFLFILGSLAHDFLKIILSVLHLRFLLGITIFYIASKKFIRNN